MKDGYIKVSAITTRIKVADVDYNVEQIIAAMKEEYKKHTKIAVFPKLCITGATCADLFSQDVLLEAAEKGLAKIANASEGHDTMFFVGLPWKDGSEVYDAIAAVQDGEILAVVSEPYNDVIFQCTQIDDLSIAVDLGDGVYPQASVVVQPVAEPIYLHNDDKSELIIKAQSLGNICAVIQANAGEGESTSDEVYGGFNMIAENGELLAYSELFTTGAITTDIDVNMLSLLRIKEGGDYYEDDADVIDFSLKMENNKLDRQFDPTPYIPEYEEDMDIIFNTQAIGLKSRMQSINCQRLIIGISGGLDSTCALLVAAKACDLLGISHKNIHAITIPSFGTSERTHSNAEVMAKALGCSFSEINITDVMHQHFKDIKHKESNINVAFENAQARERTQILMDLANDEDALVVGTGDLSEIALGWCTYNGDHMSNYAVNASIPKTLMQVMVSDYADKCTDKKLKACLLDVVATPISPELLPLEKGKVTQKTEDKVGPYELHDFFIYNMLRYGFKPSKMLRITKEAWGFKYSDDVIYKWLENFYKRFFSNQFKRSCMPDGPKATEIDLSPRTDWQMPSDASRVIWLKELESVNPAKSKKKTVKKAAK